jgi:lantibiotic modifying enzyme
MIRHHIRGPRTGVGWAWPSSIQAPQVNTDRDVGAASVGMGFIAAYRATGTHAFLHAAEQAADWLVSIARKSRGGLDWPNSASASAVDPTTYTSFDDGAIGIADFLYRVYAIDHDLVYLRAAEAALRWEEATARGAGGRRCPAVCSWRWDQYRSSGTFTGMGMGVSGIAYTFDLFAQRTGNAQDERYAEGAARYVQSLISARYDAVPEQPGQPGWDTGYVSGSAGDAFMFLSLYHHTRNRQWLLDAMRLLGFIERTGRVARGGEAWPIEFDPSGRQNNNAVALGTEEGNAGIGWVMLNAYEVTRSVAYLSIARRAGDYLLAHLTSMHGTLACAEDIAGPLRCPITFRYRCR